jgi:predicted alpha/beta-hydrolase family hydrolase
MAWRGGVGTAPDAIRKVAQTDGAGAGMDSPFSALLAQGLAERGCRVVRSRYPYTAPSRVTGKQKSPDRETKRVGARAQSVLMSVWRTCWQQGHCALDFLSRLLRGTPVSLSLPP